MANAQKLKRHTYRKRVMRVHSYRYTHEQERSTMSDIPSFFLGNELWEVLFESLLAYIIDIMGEKKMV